MIGVYKKEYNQAFRSKDKVWRLKRDYKNLEDLAYQPDQPQQPDQSIFKWTKVTKSRFNEIQNIITEAKESGLSTKIDNKKITMDNAEKLVKSITSRRINKNEARDMYNAIADEANIIINSSKSTKYREKW